MFEKIDVNGDARASAVSLAEEQRARGCSARSGSNGTSPSSCSTATGNVVSRYAPTHQAGGLEKDIEALL